MFHVMQAPSRSDKSTGKCSRSFRVVLVDDHPFVRDGLAGLLATDPQFHVVGQASSGAEALDILQNLAPDILIVDLRLPDMDGVQVLSKGRLIRPATLMIVLSAFISDDDKLAAARAGAQAYLTKTAAGSEVLGTLRRVVNGENVLVKELSPTLRARLNERDLTAKEQQVLVLLGRWLPNKEISASTGMSENTVKSHLRAIFQKLSVSNRAEATAIALRRGMV
jgi:two-component system, NarL family, response regulator